MRSFPLPHVKAGVDFRCHKVFKCQVVVSPDHVKARPWQSIFFLHLIWSSHSPIHLASDVRGSSQTWFKCETSVPRGGSSYRLQQLFADSQTCNASTIHPIGPVLQVKTGPPDERQRHCCFFRACLRAMLTHQSLDQTFSPSSSNLVAGTRCEARLAGLLPSASTAVAPRVWNHLAIRQSQEVVRLQSTCSRA